MSMPLAITPTVPPSSEPTCAAVSMPRARPETTVAPSLASCWARPRAKRQAAAEALRAPTIATTGRRSSSSEPRTVSIGGALSVWRSSTG